MSEIDEKVLFGLRIKNLREAQNLTQEEFCNLVNIDTSTLSKIENGKNFPSFSTLCTMMNILNAEPNQLLDFIKFEKAQEDVFNSLITEYIKTLPQEVKKQIFELIKTLQK